MPQTIWKPNATSVDVAAYSVSSAFVDTKCQDVSEKYVIIISDQTSYTGHIIIQPPYLRVQIM